LEKVGSIALIGFGKRIFLPGIFYWSGRAKKKSINATIGTAKRKEAKFMATTTRPS
jgi:hypothetical protein